MGVAAVILLALLPATMVVAEDQIVRLQEWRRATQASRESREAVSLRRGDRVHRPDPVLGWAPVPRSHARHARDGNYDVMYVMDSKGRRCRESAGQQPRRLG
jgi:hypothetical protein